MAAIDREMQARQSTQPPSLMRLGIAATEKELSIQREEAAARELPASLEVMKTQSYLVEAELRCHRVLQLISSMPLGFDR